MSSQSRIDLYKEAMAIEQERAALQAKLDQLHARLESIKGSLFSVGTTAAFAGAKLTSVTASAGKKARAGRGELKQRILEALAAAGDAGIRVRDLAATIGSKPAALHSWFQFARKTIKAIRKAGKGRYRLVGALPVPAKSAKAKPAKAAGKSSGKQRGYLSVAVQNALKAAGKDGISVADLAKKLSISPRNLFVWFATTGKKFKAIKKVSPGHYCLQS
jgi:transposase-like protein